MADARAWSHARHRKVAGRLATGLLAALLLAVLGAGSAAAAAPLAGWLGAGTTWPSRALVLFAPAGAKLTAATVHVSENGHPAGPLAVTALTQPGARDLGVMVLIDGNQSMSGAPFAAALAATRALAGSGVQLGVAIFNARPRLVLPISASGSAVVAGLRGASAGGAGANVPRAIALGLAQLARARVALGAILVVSDGVAAQSDRSGPSSVQVKDAAAGANVPVFTVGVQDQAASAASLSTLAAQAGGQLVKAPASHLSQAFQVISSTVNRGYVVHWRSGQRPGQNVTVSATVAHTQGDVRAGYTSPSTTTSPSALPTVPAPGHPLTAFAIPAADRLSARPSFAASGASAPSPAAAQRSSLGGPSAPASAASFWNSSAGVMALSLLVGTLLAVSLLLLFYRPSKRAVRTRVESFLPGPEDAEEGLQLKSKRRRSGLLQAFEHGRWWPPFVENVDISGSERTPVELVKRAAAAGLLSAVLLTLITGSALLGLLPIFGWPFVLRKLVTRKAGKMRDKFRDTLPGYLQDLASAMRVGRSFVGGLSAVAETAEQPIRKALERAVTDEALGRPLEEALDAVAAQMQAPDLEQVALIAGLNRRSGSNVSEALDRVAEGARERADLRREVRALTAQARMSSWVLTALPGILLLGVNVVSPLYAHPLFHTKIGVALMCLGTLMVFMGWKALKKITDVEA